MIQLKDFRIIYKPALLLICLLAFALRLYSLEDIYLHDDEALSLSRYIEHPASFILTHYTPNNHWLSNILGYMMSQLGPQRFFLRWPSVIFGTLAIPLIGLAGSLLFKNRRDGLIASLLLSLSAFHLEWSQQFRGYSALLFFALLSFLLLYQALRTSHTKYWVGVFIGSILAIISHLYGVMILIIVVAVLVSWSWYHSTVEGKQLLQRKWVFIISLLALIPAGYLIWFGKTHVINLYHTSPHVSLFQLIQDQRIALIPTQDEVNEFLKEIAITFTAQQDAGLALILFWGLALAGVALSLRQFPCSTLLLAVWLLVPIVVVILAEFAIAGFFAFDRYLIFVLPAWLMLVVRSLTVSSTWFTKQRMLVNAARPAIFIILLVAGFGYLSRLNLGVVRAYYAEKASHDWRSAAGYLADHITPADLIMCKQLPHRWPPRRLEFGDRCTRELTQRLTALGINPRYPIKQFEIVATLNSGLRFREQANTPGTVWLVIWSEDGSRRLSATPEVVAFNDNTILLKVDTKPNLIANLGQALEQLTRLDTASPDRFDYYLRLAQLLAYQGYEAKAQTYLNTAKNLAPNHPKALAETQNALQVISNLGQPTHSPVTKIRADFGAPPLIRLTGYSLPDTVQAGQAIPVTIFWQALATIRTDYTVFLHLRNAAGQTVAQLDFRPFDGYYPTSQWIPGSTIRETRFWTLSNNLPPGVYTLHVGLYEVETLARLPVYKDYSRENAVLLDTLWLE